MSDVAARRLRAQRLTGERSASAAAAVGWFGAVQAQDYGGAKWALGQRLAQATDSALDRAFDAGTLLRTHVMRPTWHFVTPDDVRWLLELTGPRVSAGTAGRHRQLGLDARTVDRACDGLGQALAGGRHLTRPELGTVLERAGISPDGQRLPHLLMAAELRGVIVSGPRRGLQHTYGLLEERAPGARQLDREAALAELTRRYFRSHGPAQAADFAWWSGLTLAEARRAIGVLGDELESELIEGREHWAAAGAERPRGEGGAAHLLPNFDEYTVAYRDRAAALHPARPFDPTLFAFGGILANVVMIGGRAAGAWRRSQRGRALGVEVRALDRLAAAERAAIEAEARRYARFLERPVELSFA